MQKFNPRKQLGRSLIDAVFRFFVRTPKVHPLINWARVKKILVLDPTRIGDLVMLTAFLSVLRANAPKAEITLVAEAFSTQLFANTNLIDSFLLLNGRGSLSGPKSMVQSFFDLSRLVLEARKTNFDVALEPRGDIRYIFLLSMFRAGRKVSYTYTGGGSLLTDAIVPVATVEHLLEDKLELLKATGCTFRAEDCVPFLILSDKERMLNQEFRQRLGWEARFVLGIHPGASQKMKQWPYFSDLVRLLPVGTSLSLILFEGPNEEESVNCVATAAQASRIPFVRIKEDLRTYIRLIGDCQHVLCNDSSAGHIAAALGVACTVIVGPNTPEFVRPIGRSRVGVVSISPECKPCRSDTCLTKDHRCLVEIGPYQVLMELMQSSNLQWRKRD